MTLPSCLRSSIDQRLPRQAKEVGADKNFSKLSTSLVLSDANTSRRDRCTGFSPSYFQPSSLFSCEEIHLHRSVRREVEEGACVCVCVLCVCLCACVCAPARVPASGSASRFLPIALTGSPGGSKVSVAPRTGLGQR
jgi:hypothetical protein